MSINGTIGNLAFYNSEKVVLGKSACYIVLDTSQTDKLFVYYLLQTYSVRRKFNAALTGTTIKNLSLAAVKKTKFNFPTITEQKKIADFLTAIDAKITAVDQQIEQMESFKKGLLQQLFV